MGDVDVQPIVDALSSADTIAVVGHVGPDGDALGSMLAIALAARGAGKHAVASFDEPFIVPDEMSFLDTSPLVPPAQFPTDLDLALAVDTSARSRVGGLAEPMERARTLGVLDHHISDGSWGDVTVIDSTAAATTELAYKVIVALGWEITPAVATALYTGLVTDTGRFQYSSTSPDTHEIAAALLRAGVEPDAIGQKLFEEAPFGYYHVASKVLDRAVFDAEHQFVWSIVTLEDLAHAGIGYHEIDPLIDLVRMARGSEIAVLIKETTAGNYKGSLRSRGTIDVARLAGLFGGGGHHNASGFTTSSPPGEIIETITAELG